MSDIWAIMVISSTWFMVL